MAIWLAAGPSGTVCAATVVSGSASSRRFARSIGSSSATVRYGAKLCTTPCDTSTIASISDSGSRM